MDKSKVLAVDVGNTRIKVGLFHSSKLLKNGVMDSLSENNFSEWLTNPNEQKIIFSSTGVEVQEFAERLKEKGFNTHLLSHESPLPFSIEYSTPNTLGRDRIAAVAGAQSLFPNQHLLVIDAGTCITYDLLTADGRYLGGNISPGIQMRLRAMNEQTHRLPLVELNLPKSRIGDSTEHALQNGGILGTILEVQGFVSWTRRKYQKIQVVLTGGDASILVERLKTRIFADAFLVLRGLNKISNLYED